MLLRVRRYLSRRLATEQVEATAAAAETVRKAEQACNR